MVKAFADRVNLPIELDEIAKWLLDQSIQDEILFIPVDLDTGVIRGFLKRVRRAKGGWDIDPDDVSYIYYDPNQGDEWVHLVCAKELLHILDAAVCATKEQFEKLTRSLALPMDMKHLLSDPDFALVDKMGSAHAAALLLPMAARAALLPKYEEGILTDEDIAKLAVIPVQHVRSVMSPAWPMVYDIIVKNGGE